MSASVLIVEDDRDISDLLSLTLSHSGFTVRTTSTVAEALTLTREKLPDVAIVDWMLAQGSGLQLIQLWRKQKEAAHLPVLFLTAKQEEHDKLMAFEKGADDYLTKPFSTKELIARLHALLRRSSQSQKETLNHLQAGALCLDPAEHRVLMRGEIVQLYPAEFKLLHFFMTHRDRVYNRAQLLDHVWGYQAALEERTIDVHIRRLRKSLEPFQAEGCIETVRSIGYRFNAHALA